MALFATPAWGAATELDGVRFRPPAQLGQDVDVAGSSWLLIVFSNGTQASGMAQFPQPSTQEAFHDATFWYREDTLDSEYPVYAPTPAVTSQIQPFEAGLGLGSRGTGSLFVQADNLSWSYKGAAANLDRKEDRICLNALVSLDRFNERAARYDELCPSASVDLLAPAVPGPAPTFEFRADGISVVEWHNAALDCFSDECPEGGSRQENRSHAGTVSVHERLLDFRRLTTQGGSLDLNGSAALIVGGGPSLDLLVHGQARLPLSSAAPACAGCAAPAGQTMALEGNFSLEGLAVQPDGSLMGRLEGDLQTVRFDEANVDPALLQGAAIASAVAATVGLLVLAKLLPGSLFTRVRPDRIARHPRRKAIQSYVTEHPGAGFRELMRATGISAASLRHHIGILTRTGHLVEVQRGRSRRFLPSPMQSPEQQNEAILLREPSLARLYDLVCRNPWSAQGELMDLAEREMAWSRSTTQHRLGRLAKGQLLETRRQGRNRLYAAKAQSPPTAFRLPPTVVADA